VITISGIHCNTQKNNRFEWHWILKYRNIDFGIIIITLHYISLQTALDAIECCLPKEAVGELKKCYDKSVEGFEILNQQKTRMEDFANICLCARILAISFLFVYSYDKEKNVILPFSALTKDKKEFIAKKFKKIINNVNIIQLR
jgi:hypothetical protein